MGGEAYIYIYTGQDMPGRVQKAAQPAGAAIDGGTQEYPVPFSGLDSEVS